MGGRAWGETACVCVCVCTCAWYTNSPLPPLPCISVNAMPRETPPQLEASSSSCCSVTHSTLHTHSVTRRDLFWRERRRANTPEALCALRLLAKRRQRQRAGDPPQLTGAQLRPGWTQGAEGRGQRQEHVGQGDGVCGACLLLGPVGAAEHNLEGQGVRGEGQGVRGVARERAAGGEGGGASESGRG